MTFVVCSMLLVLKVALSSALVTTLSCNASLRSDGRIELRLSPDPGPDCEGRSWQTHNKTVITQGSSVNKTLVHNQTNTSLILEVCLNVTYFNAECPGFVEATCRYDCSSAQSLVSNFDQTPVVPVSTVPPSVHPSRDPSLLGPVLGSVFVVPVVLVVLLVFKKRRGKEDLQRRATELDKEKQEGEVVIPMMPLQGPDETKSDALDNGSCPVTLA